MIHKKRIQALGLACLVGLMSLGPAAESLAAVSWTKNNGVYIGSDGTSIAGVVARGIDVSHWKQAIDWKASDGEDVNCWICLGVPQSGEEDQVKIIGTLCRKIIHKEFIHQLQQGDTDQVLALLNQTLSS